MHIAISTHSLSPNTPEALERAAALDFSHVEANLQQDEFGYGYRRKTNARFYRQLGGRLKELGLSVWSATTPPLTQAQMFYERARKDILMSGAIAAGLLGARAYVVEPADIFTTEINVETYLRQGGAPPVIEGYDEAWVQAVNRRMTMALRNKDHWVGAPLVNQAERMATVTEDLAVGWAMDVRRALNRNDLQSWLDAAGERLTVAYLYDIEEDGRHVPPASEEWQEWLPVLAQTNLKCVVIHAPAGAGDDTLTQSRTYLQEILDAATPDPASA